MSLISIVVPAYNEGRNLPVLHERISKTMQSLGLDWECIVVDDHSKDDTFAALSKLANADPRIRGVRFSRNLGSHIAIACGFRQARGECVVMLAADLQDPPEKIPELLEQWRKGAQVVWAVRRQREGEKLYNRFFARVYYYVMRRFVRIEMPPSGADFFLLDRSVLDAFLQFRERNLSILALITWMGFRQAEITYDKQARLHGSTGWSLKKKIDLIADSFTAFTFLPIRLMSYVGFITAFLGFLYAGFVVSFYFLHGYSIGGWPSLMIVVLVLGGIQMLMLGMLGEYVWRALDESRRRPLYLIEASTSQENRVAVR